MEFKEIVSKVAKNYKDRSETEAKNTKIWIREVGKLYQKVNEWLAEYIEKGDIIVETGESQYYDSDGTEETYTMYLSFGSDIGPSVVLEPTGINITGALGKIDLYYLGHKEETVYLLLVKENDEKFGWQIMKSSDDCRMFSKELFEKQISEWIIKWADV